MVRKKVSRSACNGGKCDFLMVFESAAEVYTSKFMKRLRGQC